MIEIELIKQPGQDKYLNKKLLAGVVIVILLAITSTIEMQFANSMAAQNFTAFAFLTW